MKKNFIIVLLSWLIILSSCLNGEEHGEEHGEEQKGYTVNNTNAHFALFLKSKFHVTPPNDNIAYIIIPDNGCSSCSAEALNYIATKNPCNTVSLVVSNTIRKIPKQTIVKIRSRLKTVYADTSFYGKNELDRLDLPFKSFTGIISIQDSVWSYHSFDANNYKQVISSLYCKSR